MWKNLGNAVSGAAVFVLFGITLSTAIVGFHFALQYAAKHGADRIKSIHENSGESSDERFISF